ncbi:tetratricopeptide repeat protein [Corynebacterium sp. CNCTC7651]|nr:tetratricopeptide repeat protein [Corynebacterium sp. CNCTC7651]UIZ92979.1 tetratricopeptide repeat protein [Corynebacterium sp. CNCTC7651]
MADFNQAFTGGAVDLGEVARQAEARRELAGTEFVPFYTVDDATIETHAFERSLQIPVVVLFGSARSAESEVLKADFERLAAGQQGFAVAYVDTDASPQLAQAIGVRAIPTVIALAGGRPVTSFEGGQPADQLEAWVNALVTQLGPQLRGLDSAGNDAGTDTAEPDTDPRLAAATAALQGGDLAQARSLYDAISADPQAPTDLKAAAARGNAAVTVAERVDAAVAERVGGASSSGTAKNPAAETGSDAMAGAGLGANPIAALVGEAEADKGNVEKQMLAADVEVLSGDPEGAFARLLPLVKAEPAAKARLLELFTLFEPGDTRVKAARTQLASALF